MTGSPLRFLCVGLLAVGLPTSASATSLSFPFSGPIAGPDAGGAIASGSVTFDWNENCVGTVGSPCQLGVTLTYSDTGGTDAQGQVLAGVLFEPIGTADFRDGPPGNNNFGGTVGAPSLGGDMAGNMTLTMINAISNPAFAGHTVDITGHWGVNPAISLNLTGNFGSVLLSSVGSLFENLVNPPQSLSSMQLFPGTQYLNKEANPPDGSAFGIIEPGTTMNQFLSGFGSDTRVFAVGSIRANINYVNQLTNITFVDPIFGTTGVPIPEPGTAALLGFGLVGLLGSVRHLRR